MEAVSNRQIDLDCGIAYSRIEAWLRDELALPAACDGWTFAHEGATCCIRIEPLEPRSLGSVSLERCSLHAEGAPAAIDEFERLFTLRFMSAGG